MHGSRRVITFCLLTTVLPSILIVLPLYLRNIKYADVMYQISDSDVIQIHKGQSSVFCEKHSLKMNTTFNAFQMRGRPELSDNRRHIRLKKSMTLPDDTLEYWGFYLFKGATVELKACSRYIGSKILVVKGERIFNTCGIIDGDKYKKDPPTVQNQGHVVITLENPEEEKENKSIPLNYDEDNVVEDESWYDEKENNSTHLGNNTDKTFVKFSSPVQNEIQEKGKQRSRRNIRKPPLHNPNTVLDAGVNHGGNALNTSVNTPQDSVSSFENSLYDCYHDNMLINNYFPHSMQCNSTDYLEKTTTLKVIHNVTVDGYYYYLFYSDNDIVRNDIHVIFDIYKPTFQYVNMEASKVCVNQTECEFNVRFFSDELVIVEVPTKDGLKNDDSDTSILVSVCHPRMSVYIIFPISVLLMILIFAFL
ncbi:uncharacterized protein LOC126369518 isoform X2 [Pectinophora gossypiella]|uniref:E3 ubiquitin-protein ligase APD1-4 middle domain-containing protein n=2 Tax=Pectinophora gossypiella TaxID=13191 RepID=A0A1E1W3B8_PECGO|nr:uncharacterized protein LOC126369518 isoform X2 [Pectinophora gossypiella]XP_049869967.1 uncharacterized protein LOC126369518 isoform X2 [Pectinophora gossypiella]